MGGVNPKYESIRTQVTSKDMLPPIGTVFALLQGEESRRLVMNSKPDVVLISNNVGNRMQNTGYGGYSGAEGVAVEITVEVVRPRPANRAISFN